MAIKNLGRRRKYINCHQLLYKGDRFTYVKKYNREHKKNSLNINLIDQISGMGHILIEF